MLNIGNPQLAIEQRRGQVERGRQSQGGLFRLSYTFNVTGAGEAEREINFPVWFVNPPALSHGGEVEATTVLESGNFPWSSVMACGYSTQLRAGVTYYVGCRVLLVMGGTPEQKGTLHFHVEGQALQGPVS